MSDFAIQLFGSFALRDARGTAVPLSAKKARALLAFLALSPHQAHPRDKLAALLWEDVPDLQARTSLRQALAVLRPALARLGTALEATPETISLTLPRDGLDVARFEDLAAAGTPDALRQAAAIYRGDLLDGLHVRAAGFEDWLAAERQRLREMALQALVHVLDHEIASGEWEHGVHTALRLLAFDPLRESAHRSLMQLYARTGRQALALRQYERCRDLLRAELGLAPEPETDALFREIREQRRRSAEPSPVHAPPPAEAATEAAGPPPEPEPVNPELRQITILIADLDPAGSDPEELHRCTLGFRQVAAEAAGRHRAVWRRHGASGVLVAFGVRRIRGDECVRAVQAAQVLHEGVAGRCDGRARIGVACGLVLVAEGESDEALTFTGDTVASAERLARAAAPGTTLLGDSARAACGDRLRAAPGGLPDLPSWVPLGWMPGAAAHWRSPFVGREAERHQFEIVAERCRAAGEACLIYIRGEAGIGKSRLADRFRTIALGLGYAFHSGAFVDFGLEPGGGGIRMLVRSLLDADSEGAAARLDAVEAAGLIGAEQKMFLELVLNLAGTPQRRRIVEAMDTGTRYAGARDAVVGLITALSQQAPRFLLLEDFHWADREARDFLAAIVERLAAVPAVIVLTARPDQDPVDRAWRAATRSVPLVTMDLTPLRPEEARLVADSYAVPPGRRDTCVARAAGNAYFLEQLLVSHDEVEEDVPDSVRGVVLARLDRLAAGDRAALQAASVLGQRFTLDALGHLLENPGYGCEPLLDHALLRRDGDDHVFDHALLRDAVYASLLRSRRRRLHARAAEWYAGRDKVLYAQHLERAEDPRAAVAYLEAAQMVFATYRLERALRLVEAAERTAGDANTRALAAVMAGDLLLDLGRVGESRERLQQVVDAEVEARQRCRALAGIAAAYRLEDRTPEALAALKEAEALSVDDLDCARIHLLRANLLFAQGRIRDCEVEHERALRSARKSGSAELEVQALGGLGDGCYASGDMRQALEHFEACVARAREGGFPRVEAAHLPMLAITKHFCLRRAEALADVAAGAEIALRIGDLRSELLAELVAVEILHGRADAAPIENRLPRVFELVERIGSRRFMSEALVFKGHALRLRGRIADALRCLEEALEICRETGMGYMGAQVLGALAAMVEDSSRRRWLLQEGEEVLRAGAVSHNHLFFYRDAIQASLVERRWKAAEAYADRLEEVGRTDEGPLPWSALHATVGRLQAARGRGRPAAAFARVRTDCLAAGMERLAAQLDS